MSPQPPPRLLARLRSDLKPFSTSPPPGCSLATTDNALILDGEIVGATDTPFEGGVFKIVVTVGGMLVCDSGGRV